MNLYEFSEKNNREMGVLLEKVEDESLYKNAIDEVASIIKAAVEIERPKPKTFAKLFKEKIETFTSTKENNSKKHKSGKGYCIRYEEKIAYNPDRPYCKSCFNSWSEWENYDYVENVCHGCGKDENTSMM